MATETELAYLAGIIDGEGSIGAHGETLGKRNGSYQVNVQVGMTQIGSLDLFVKVFGGRIGLGCKPTSGGKPVYKWRLSARKAANCLEQLTPYLILKREQARDAIALARMNRQRLGKGTSPGYALPVPEDEKIMRREIANRIYQRNFSSNSRCRKWASYGNHGEKR